MDLLVLILAQTDAQTDAQTGTGGSGGFQNMASWFALGAGVVILTWTLMRLQWKRQRRSPEDDAVAEMRETLDDRQADMERAAEVGAIVRDLAARLETRAARLEALLDQADERIENLEARLAAGAVSNHVAEARMPAEPRRAAPEPASDPWAETDEGPAKPNASDDPLHQEVYELADGGQSPLDIARRLDQQVGTIELILALRQ